MFFYLRGLGDSESSLRESGFILQWRIAGDLTLLEVNSFLERFGIGQKLSQVEPSLVEDFLGCCIQIKNLILSVPTRYDIVDVRGTEQLLN